jgi:uncharacterized protein (TIGR03083 family)
MEREKVFAVVADERRSIAKVIDGLDADQLATASLCAGWDVKTVAAHLVSDFTDGFCGFLIRTTSPGCSISSQAQHNSASSRVDACEESNCTTTTPAENGATVNRFAGPASR